MNDFDEMRFGRLEQALEKKFQLEEERRFRVVSHAAHLFGLWAAGQLGLKGDASETYAMRMVEDTLDKEGYVHLLDDAEKDLTAKGVSISRHRLEKRFDEFMVAAQSDIARQGKPSQT